MGIGLFQYPDIPSLTQGQKQYENYQETLASLLVPLVKFFGGTDLTFQHDNPSIHATKSTSKWLSSNMGSVLSGLALSSDFNFIENVWGKFTNLVYKNSKQYSSVEVLKLANEDVWFELQP
ncbi:hypothetical protein AVEN_214106-1 [Araneus ventricosus]|uniref:Tc1-like transposase DDE domain-containing protein n=1 Tax=Araneus ventricosus TaxID=182803 RepID=A0A4Y2C6F9_ARAVE|nr:hypothetical protein AVEN_214106-1 [Araneus ventricosus]